MTAFAVGRTAISRARRHDRKPKRTKARTGESTWHIVVMGARYGIRPSSYARTGAVTVINGRLFASSFHPTPGWRWAGAIAGDHLFDPRRTWKRKWDRIRRPARQGASTPKAWRSNWRRALRLPRHHHRSEAFLLTRCRAPVRDRPYALVCTVDHAEKTWAHYQEFLKEPGPAIIGAMPGASCYGPALRVRLHPQQRTCSAASCATRCRSPSSPPNPTSGTWGLGGVGDSKSMLESEFRNNDIKWITNAKVTRRGWQMSRHRTGRPGAGEGNELPFRSR